MGILLEWNRNITNAVDSSVSLVFELVLQQVCYYILVTTFRRGNQPISRDIIRDFTIFSFYFGIFTIVQSTN
jgi:hypothetical protein